MGFVTYAREGPGKRPFVLTRPPPRLSLSLGIVSSVLILLLLSSMFRRFALHGLLNGEFA